MSDWGNLIPVFLRGKPAMILLIFFAIVAFMPIPAFEQFRQEFSPWVEVVGALAVASVLGNLLFWLKDYLCSSQVKKKEEDLATEAIWGRFTRLHPEVQMFVIRLFFSGRMSTTARLDDPMAAALRDQGFLTVINGGMAMLDKTGELVITVMISQPMLEFMEKHSEEFRKQADRIMNSVNGD